MRIHKPAATPGHFAGLAFLLSIVVGCGGGGSSDGTATLTGVPQADHAHIPLLDRSGNHLTMDSTEPYSPRQTCGRCHDYDRISKGYHFQQGRIDDMGQVAMMDDFFDDGRVWLKSPGMYGKW